MVAACSKENTTVPVVQANEANSNLEWRWPFPRGGGDTELVTTFGLINERSSELSAQEGINLTEDQMDGRILSSRGYRLPNNSLGIKVSNLNGI